MTNNIRNYDGAGDYNTDRPAFSKTVTVTAEDKQKGVQTSCFLCPVARAIQRECPEFEPLVGPHFAFLRVPDDENGHVTRYIAVIPDEVRKFIYSFDHLEYTQTKTPEPFVLNFYKRK